MFPAQFMPYPERLTYTEVIPNTRVAAAGDTDSGWIDLNEFEGNVALVLQAEEISGTDPTLNVTIEHRQDSDDTPAAIPASSLQDGAGNNATFAEVTDVAEEGLQVLALIRSELRAQIQVTVTVGGTSSPTFDFSALLVGSNKYGAQ
jgi:hypothetical protein